METQIRLKLLKNAGSIMAKTILSGCFLVILICAGALAKAGKSVCEINSPAHGQISSEMRITQMGHKNSFDFRYAFLIRRMQNVKVNLNSLKYHGPNSIFSTNIPPTEEQTALFRLRNSYASAMVIAVIGLLILLILVIFMGRLLKDHKQVQKKLQESEKRYRELFNHVMDVVFSCDASGRILQVNPVITELLGDRKVLGEVVWDLLPKGERNKWKEYIFKTIEKGERRFTFETRIFNYRAELVYLEINGFIKYDPQDLSVNEIFGIARNITEHKHLSRMVLKASIEAQESERKRFAFEIHDGIGPLLSGMKMYLQQDALTDNLNARQIKVLSFCRQILDDAIAQTRLISGKLAPGLLNDFGLGKALKAYVSRLEMMENCTLHLDTEGDLDLEDKDIALNIYRVATELISNSLKHSQASHIRISIKVLNGNIIKLSFGDNGRGFDAGKLFSDASHRGRGLYNIISRVKVMDGNIVFDRPVSGGASVVIEIPLGESGWEK